MGLDKRHLLQEARALWAGGLSSEAVAKQLGVGAQTIYRWRKRDRAAGFYWEALRARLTSSNPAQLVPLLEGRLLEVLTQEGLDPLRRAEAIGRVSRALQCERGRFVKRMREARKGDNARTD
ncbi:MAG: helix-turn-helix domain-containing protein [Candidatus Brocadiae bacterium]|nr:helix-turn-helix domain-containing protein [Candidatus Brocadiia bacterium]